MGTYVDLDGDFENITPAQVKKFDACMKDNDARVEVDDDGHFSFHDNCGYSFWDRFTEALQEFCLAENLQCEVTSECEGEDSIDFFGSEFACKMQLYDHLVRKLESAQKEYDVHAVNVTDAERAQWKLESGG